MIQIYFKDLKKKKGQKIIKQIFFCNDEGQRSYFVINIRHAWLGAPFMVY